MMLHVRSGGCHGDTDLSTGATVMPPPGEGELTGADHAHGGPQVRDPDGSLGAQRGPAVHNTLGLMGERRRVNMEAQNAPNAPVSVSILPPPDFDSI